MLELGERTRKLEQFLDRIHNDWGLIYSDVKANDLRPWRNEDLAGYDLWEKWHDNPAEHTYYEDAIMATARYVGFKTLKHMTGQGDSDAHQDAERAVRALLMIASEGEKREPGFFPKPYGGLENASDSTYISCDQYEHALFALWRFRRVFPESSLAPEIAQVIVRWADYFIRHDFRYQYFGYAIAAIEEKPAGDLPVSVGVHALGLYLPLMRMAYEISGDARYEETMRNRLFPILFDHADRDAFSPGQNICNLLVIGLHFCWKRGCHRDKIVGILEKLWRLDAAMLSADGLGYEETGVTDGHWITPHYDDPPPLNCRLFGWHSNLKTAHSVKTAHSGALIERVQPDAPRAATIRRILRHFERPSDFLRWIDPDGRQVPAEFAYLCNTVPLQFVGAWLEAYYLNLLPPEVDGL